jgi:hypothetical protein
MQHLHLEFNRRTESMIPLLLISSSESFDIKMILLVVI